MSVFGNIQAGDEARYPHPPQTVWPVLRAAVAAHPSITRTTFDDVALRAEFQTSVSMATWGQAMSAVVSPDQGGGSRLLITGVSKWSTAGGRDQTRVRKIAGELMRRVSDGLADVPLPEAARLAAGISIADELAKLAALRDQGVLTEEQFESLKAKLLA